MRYCIAFQELNLVLKCVKRHDSVNFLIASFMKVSQELSILFWLRHKNESSENKAAIMVRLTLVGERTDFSLGLRRIKSVPDVF